MGKFCSGSFKISNKTVSVSLKKFHPNLRYNGVFADPLILSKGMPFVKLKGFSNFADLSSSIRKKGYMSWH